MCTWSQPLYAAGQPFSKKADLLIMYGCIAARHNIITQQHHCCAEGKTNFDTCRRQIHVLYYYRTDDKVGLFNI